jgi:hypothetical protein
LAMRPVCHPAPAALGEDDIVADFALTEPATERLVAEWHTDYPDLALVLQSDFEILRWARPGTGTATA